MLPSRLRNELITAIHAFHSNGWAPATTTNYSFRNVANEETTYSICAANVDRSRISEDDLIVIDRKGRPTCETNGLKLPADTLLHTILYENDCINAVLHTHSVNGTVLSMLEKEKGEISFKSYEALNALSGMTKGQKDAVIPIFEYNEDIRSMCSTIKQFFGCHSKVLGFLLVGHGLYTWGETIEEAKNQIEVFEFIFSCEVLYRQLQPQVAHEFH